MSQQTPPRSGRPATPQGQRARSGGGGSARPARGRSTSAAAIAGYTFLVVLCLGLTGLSFLYVAAPLDVVRDRLAEEVRARTGRALVVAGPVSLALFPTPSVTLSQVSLAAPAGFGETPTLKMRSLAAEIGLNGLLTRKVQVRRVVLSEPYLDLRVDRNGRRSWDFASMVPEQRVQLAQARGPSVRDTAPVGAGRTVAPNPQVILAALADALPGELRVASGRARYLDERTGETLEISGIDADVSASDVTHPVSAQGTLVIRGQPLVFTGRLTSLSTAVTSGRADVGLKASGAPFAFDLDGTAMLRNGRGEFDGAFRVKSASVAALGLWLGRPMAVSSNGALSLSSRVTFADDRLSLVTFDGELAGKPAQGSVAIDFKPARPRVTGNVELASLDFGSLLLSDGSAAPGPAAPSAEPSDPIGDLLRKDKTGVGTRPQVRGFTQRSGGARDWSDDRLDPRVLAMADAELRISAREIVVHDIRTGPSQVSLNLTDRQLRLDLEDLDLYGGRGRGVATLDAAGDTPAVSLNLSLENVSAGPLLKDAVGTEWLEGRTGITLALAGQGYSERQVVDTLAGTVEIKTNGGTIAGFNIPKIMRQIETGQIPAMQVQPSEKTSFSEFGGTFVISKGVAQNNDLRLYTQNARLTGAGTINLPRRHLDYNLKAKLTGTGAREQGTVVSFSNIEIPLRVEGPWDKPSISLKGQDQILEGVRQIGKNLKNPEVQDALKGLFGGNSENRVKPRDLLDKLLKKE